MLCSWHVYASYSCTVPAEGERKELPQKIVNMMTAMCACLCVARIAAPSTSSPPVEITLSTTITGVQSPYLGGIGIEDVSGEDGQHATPPANRARARANSWLATKRCDKTRITRCFAPSCFLWLKSIETLPPPVLSPTPCCLSPNTSTTATNNIADHHSPPPSRRPTTNCTVASTRRWYSANPLKSQQAEMARAGRGPGPSLHTLGVLAHRKAPRGIGFEENRQWLRGQSRGDEATHQ